MQTFEKRGANFRHFTRVEWRGANHKKISISEAKFRVYSDSV